MIDRQSLRAALEALPRLALATLPTPLQEATRLREALGGRAAARASS